jgi:hypothetical protein
MQTRASRVRSPKTATILEAVASPTPLITLFSCGEVSHRAYQRLCKQAGRTRWRGRRGCRRRSPAQSPQTTTPAVQSRAASAVQAARQRKRAQDKATRLELCSEALVHDPLALHAHAPPSRQRGHGADDGDDARAPPRPLGGPSCRPLSRRRLAFALRRLNAQLRHRVPRLLKGKQIIAFSG